MKKRNLWKRLLALCLCMALTCLPMTAFAEAEGSSGSTGSSTTESGTSESGASTAYGQTTGNCTTCGGTYTNGFCSNDGTHYQAPDGEGTAEKPYEIDNAGKLYWFAAQANAADSTYTGCAVLTADITVNPGTFAADGTYTPAGTEYAKVWSPICNANSLVAYTGTFDGQDHSISGLYYNRNCEDDYGDDYAGLFGHVGTGGTVKNVTVKSSYFAATGSLGAIVGLNYGTVKNCHGRDNYLVGVMIEDIGYNNCIGGVVGFNGGTLDQLSNIGGAVSGDEDIGGVVGYNYSDSDILNCYNTAPVTGTRNVGGVVGTVWIDTTDITIRFCYNVGTISGNGNVGGIVGLNESTGHTLTFRGCYYQEATGLNGVSNSTDGDGITSMTEEQFDSGYVVSQIVPEWQTYVNEFNGNLSSEELDKRLKENVWFMDPATKLPAFDGDMVVHDGKIYGTRPSAGSGTAADPYQIDSYLDLKWFSAMLKGNHDYSLCAKLTADIVANPGTFDADGNYTPGADEAKGTEAEGLNTVGAGDPYVGTFDGQGHSISGLYYENQGTQGLFFRIGAGGTVKNVIIAKSYFGGDNTESAEMGAIAAHNYGTVENCGVLDSVYFNASNTTSGVVGGVVGTNYSGGTVKNCFSAASVSGVGTCGGVVGSNAGKVENCYYLQAEGLSGIGNDTAEGNTTTAVTDFSTGEVTYKLNGDQSAIVWYQTLGTDGDKYPVLDSTHGTVYLRSDGSYGNSATVECTHQYENGICTKCDAYQEPDADILGSTYTIANAGNLYWFAQQVNSGNTGIDAILTADITVNENVLGSGNLTNGLSTLRRWTPIGDGSNNYTGFFDGNGHTISGLYYYNGTPSADNAYYVGLFGYVKSGASIEDVGLIDSYFCVNETASGTTGVYLGGIVAYAYNKVTISGCHSGAVLYVNNYSGASIGGIVGYVYNSMTADPLKVRDCYNTGDLYGYGGTASGGNTLGGIVGYANVGNSITVSGCYNTGTLSGGENSNVGGTVGVIAAGSSSITVSDCYNTGKLTGDSTSSNVGGAVGMIESSTGRGTISNCYNAGELSGTLCGGVAGYAYSSFGSIAVNNCYFTNTESGALGQKNNNSSGSISVDDKTGPVTTADVASGKVVYLLNNERTPSVWKQDKNSPAFKGDDVGYNSESDSYVLSHTYVDGACNVCGAICAHGTVENEICTICNCTYAAEVKFPLETKYYFTVNEAFAAVINDATITLLRDATIQSTIEICNKDANITLIGGGYTLSADCTIFKITKGTLTVQSGTYITTGGNVFYISGVATVPNSNAGGITTPDIGKGDVVTDIPSIGTGDIPGIGTTTTATDSGTVKIAGGTFKSNGHTVCIARDTAVSTDESTTFTTYTEKGKAEIGGGTFTSTGGYAIYVGTESIANPYLGGDLIVSGGVFNGGLYIVNMIVGIEDDVSVKLSGGTFDRIDYSSNKADILQQYYAYFTKDTSGAYTVLTAAADVGTNAVQIKPCTHVYTKADGKCDICGMACDHPAWDSATGACTTCGYGHDHSTYDADGFCTVCHGGYQAPTLNSDGYYQIDNAGKLYWFAQQVNSGNTSINGKLTANIVINKNLLNSLTFDENGNVTNGDSFRQWTPIGNESNQYKGTFDGENHIISGLYYNGSAACVGLFGYIVGGANVKNVGVVDNYLCVSGANGGLSVYVGGLVGYVYSNSDTAITVENCYHTGKVSESTSARLHLIGGLVGYIYNETSASVTLQNCYNTGAVSCTTSDAYAGALIGFAYAPICTITIQKCYWLNTSANQGIGAFDNVSGSGTLATADEFASGKVAWLLNGSTSSGVWKQTIGTDTSPNFTGGTVYPVYKCDGSTISDSVYANSAGKKLPHVNENGTCSGCNQALAVSVTVGETTDYYVTLSEAFAAASGKTATITLLNDTTLTSTVEIGDAKSNITLVGGTHIVSAACTMFKITAGTLTVQSGTYTATSGQELVDPINKTYAATSSHVFEVTGGTLTAQNGTYSTALGHVFHVTGGTANVQNGSYTTTSGNVIDVSGTTTEPTTSSGSGSSSGETGLYTPTTATVGTVNVEGGSFTSENGYAVYVGSTGGTSILGCGKLNVSGGSFGKLYIAGLPTDEVVLTGGTFTGVEFNFDQMSATFCAAILKDGYGFFDGDDKGVKLTDVSDDVAGTVKLCTAHGWDSATGACTTCGYNCPHVVHENGFCTVCGGGYQEPNRDSSGTYLIANAGNLYWFAAQVNSGNTSINAKLTDNIIVNASALTDGKLPDDTSALKQWTPIGNSSTAYKGTFDGQNYTISGLFYNGSDEYVGLFGYIAEGATIQNVGVIDSCFQVSGSSAYLGGIVGCADAKTAGSITISNCSSAALLAATGKYVYVGGVAGLGVATGSASVTIQSCSNTGKITATSTSSPSDSYVSVGGVAGQVYSSEGAVTIQNCFNTGDLTATSTDGDAYCGGVAGYVDASKKGAVTIQNCFSTGAQKVIATSASGSAYSGGVAGYVYADADATGQGTVTLSDCYYTAADAYGYKYVGDGAIVKTDKLATKTAEQFKSGEVAYLLNGQTSDADVVWKQTLSGTGRMSVPGFSGGTVYCNYKDCKDTEYSNIQGSATPLHDYTNNNGFCKVCGGYEPCEGAGTATEPYLIKNAGNLYRFAALVNTGGRKINAKLTADIIVNATVNVVRSRSGDLTAWTPIGSAGNQYAGTFDGDGHTISGLYYNGDDQYVGLFGYLTDGATIQNVTVTDSYFDCTAGIQAYVGGLAGYADAQTYTLAIQNCAFRGTITRSGGDGYVGGLVGRLYVTTGEITVKNCSFNGKATASGGNTYAGGFAGKIEVGSNDGKCTIENSYATGNVTASGSNTYAGGLVGHASTNGTLTVTNCYATGAVTANASTSDAYAGGLVGYAKAESGALTVTNCYAIGAVSASTGGAGEFIDRFEGGLVGCAKTSTVTLSNCYYQEVEGLHGVGNKTDATGVTAMTAAQFASGEVAYLLNGGKSDDAVVWKQTLVGAGKMTAPGFTGQIVTYDNAYGNAPFVSVTITWTSMEFTYTDGKWDPDTHTYGAGTWTNTGGTITVENTGNVAITVSFAYSSDRTDISGSFTKPSFGLAADARETTALKLSGKPSTSLDNAAIGTITITIAQAKQGWQTENGATYYYVDGEKTTQWLQLGETWYYFDTDGAMQTGWYTGIADFEGKLFYFDLVTGAMKTGWMQDGGSNWYYLDPATGVMQTGWKQIDENWYYFHDDGHMATGETVDGIWIDADGKADTSPNV